MERQNDTTRAAGDSRFLLSRHDWVYLLSLLVPFVVYDLVLEVSVIASRPDPPWLMGGIGLMRSDLLFDLGYALLWVGLFSVARKGAYRWIVVGLLHLVTLSAALITTAAYRYFYTTGSTLDSDYILLWLSAPEGTGGAIASGATLGFLVLVLAIVLYGILGPWLVTRFVDRWRGWPGFGAGSTKVSWIRLAGVGLAAYALFSFSLLPGSGLWGANQSFSRDAFATVSATATEVAESGGIPEITPEPVDPPPEASLVPTSESERRNVVLVVMDSVRAGSTTPYNQELSTTPFLDELANKSLLAERAYPVVTHSNNAVTATSCGIEPPLDPWGTKVLGSFDDVVPSTCLTDLLEEQGYNSVYFTSSTSAFENTSKIVDNLGYNEYYPVETMNTEGFEQANYFGYEDDVMLEPSKNWLEANKDQPFMATYFGVTPHHEYLAPQKRYGREEYTENDLLNRYLNGVRYEDFFLKNLFDQYKELGLYDDTVFVILGDHGQAFGEHGRFQHDNVPYEEGQRIPMIIHDPRQFQNGERVTAPVSQLDVLPTVAELLGYRVEGGAYPGYSLLDPIPEDRTLLTSCWNESGCMASIKGTDKYIYNFDNKPEEVFDLSEDPGERNNLAGQRTGEELEERRRELLDWRARVNSMYGIQARE